MDEAPSTSDVEGAAARWMEGLEEETDFWLRWLRDEGGPWPEDFRLRTDPAAQLQPHIRKHIHSRRGAHVRILDVGSGPLTVLGKRWPGHDVEITAVDPLADQYATLFERTGVAPIVKPVHGEAEHVADLFPPRSFDLVYAQNCIDHGYDPLRSIQQMLELARPTGAVLLEHAIDEGEYMKYAGPHQWNFRAEHGRFVIWRPGLRVDAQAELERAAYVDVENCPDIRWIRLVLRRNRPSRLARLLRRDRT